MSTFLRRQAVKTKTSISKFTEHTLRIPLDYRGHTVKLKTFLDTMRNIAPAGRESTLHFIRRRYKLPGAEQGGHISMDPTNFRTVSQLKKALRIGAIEKDSLGSDL